MGDEEETEAKQPPSTPPPAAIITRATSLQPFRLHHSPTHFSSSLQDKEEDCSLDLGSDELDLPLPLTITSRVLYMLGDITTGPAYRFAQWLELVRKRSGRHRSSGFPHHHRLHPHPSMPSSSSAGESIHDPKCSLPSENDSDISLWEKLGKAAMIDIESSSFSWTRLSSLHHTEHGSSTEQSEDESNKALEVTVNSGGVVFFALFNIPCNGDSSPKEASAVIKISSSRMATQSERLGYEFAKWLGVRTPQARVIHNSSPEWVHIKEAAEKARDAAKSDGDEVGEMTCTELLEALDLSRCLLLMSYIHGSPLMESTNAFDSKEAAEKTAAALGRILMLDLVIRNEDRLPCHELRWRGNPANLLLADKVTSGNLDALEEAFDSAVKRYRPRVIRALQKERRASSVDSKLNTHNSTLASQRSDLSDVVESPSASDMCLKSQVSVESTSSNFEIVAIDSGVPRRPPAGKRANDQAIYPKLVELLLNSSDYSSSLLHNITGGKLGTSLSNVDESDPCQLDMTSVVQEFRNGFRAALRDLQGFHIFLLTLHQKLECHFRAFLNIINKNSGEFEKEDVAMPESPSHATGHCMPYPSPMSKERDNYDHTPMSKDRVNYDHTSDRNDQEFQRTVPKLSLPGHRESTDSNSPMSRESCHGKLWKGSGEPLRSLRLTAKLRDFHKFAKACSSSELLVDAELNKELEQWNEVLKNDAVKLCLENNFSTGFFEGGDNNFVVDAYELKVRLEHILERTSLISDAANTERPSAITSSLFIGGALAARSVYTLRHLGITHILCLCSNEIGQADSQYPDLFEYKNFSICDEEDTDISNIFEEASNFIDRVEQTGGRILVHCFEGRSRSATLVLAYLMLKKNCTLLEAWNTLKGAHRRAHPNDGFAKTLLDLDKKLHGKVSMEWQQRKPVMKVCPICGKNAGLSSSSLKLHVQKAHKKLSSGSVDSAMTMEIQKALTALKISRGGSVSPTQRQSPTMDDSE
ncbi:Actin-fragmin kinase, catalytic domain [Dillenia turbinata]|uniref:Actin-fragmin kinase, catalytic domain n=1 Tax=Dillenia turbinata TaxID=194707 RepID=A0AAN8UX12_9MAGN